MLSYLMVNNFIPKYGMPFAMPQCSVILIMKLENSMETLLIYLMNTLLVANVFLMVKQLAAQTHLKKVHLFSTQINRNGVRE